jgi:16S rRNA (cytidine1402-2'-O)-methyltransferase
VATPIGNLGDITLRALDVLRAADVIACEDTRVTRRLLSAYGIDRRLVSYHDHNADRMRPALLKRIGDGESVALVSDAGTPLVSDPGYKLVQACVEAAIPVTALPGASSVLMALQLSGLPTDRFLFAGFLPSKAGARRGAIAELAKTPATIVFFESARRLEETLADLAEAVPGRQAAVARELTKLFEEVRRGEVGALARHYAEAGPPKGEVVIVLAPSVEEEAEAAEVDRALSRALQTMGTKEAAAAVAAATGWPKREVYARALAITRPEHAPG